MRWRRFTATGALASIVAGNRPSAWARRDGFCLAGFLPVFWAVLAGSVAAVMVQWSSLLGRPPDPEAMDRAFA